MIFFFEPVHDPALISGGYRYNSEIGRRLASTRLGTLVQKSAAELEAGLPQCTLEHPDSILVFDSLYVQQIDPPAWLESHKLHTRILLHFLPSLNPLLTESRKLACEEREKHWIEAVGQVITTSAYLAGIVLERFNLHAHVATPGVSGCFRAKLGDRQRTASTEPSDTASVVSVGSITPEKGQLVIAVAMAASLKANSGLRHKLILIGDETADPEYTAAIEKAAAGYELVLTGCLPSEKVAEHLSSASLFVSASVFESYGMAIAEAAAMGIPVVSFRVGEVDEWVQDGANGYLLDPKNDGGMIEQVVELFGDEERLAGMREQSHKLFFPSWEFTLKRFLRGCRSEGSFAGNTLGEGPVLYSTCELPTRFGSYAVKVYRLEGGEEAIVIAMGDLSSGAAPFVRVHSECFTGEILHSLKCDCRLQLEVALQSIAERKRGAVVYQRQEGRGIGLGNKILAYAEQQKGADTVEANERLGFPADMREFRAAAEILKLEGVRSVHLNTNNPDKVTSLEAHGIRVERVVPSRTLTNPHNVGYLLTKYQSMGHSGLEDALQLQGIESDSEPLVSAASETGQWGSGIVGTSRPEALAQLNPSETLLIVDLDGVIKVETGIPPEARQLLANLRTAGYTIRFLTNDGINSRRTRCEESLRDGLAMDVDELYTASYLTARYLREQRRGAILPLFGSPSLEEFEGIPISLTKPRSVVVGDYFPHYDYEAIKAAYTALEGGAELVAMHRKPSWPTEGRRVVDIGFWVAGLEYCAGVPATIVGKPGAFGYETVMADTGFSASNTVMISDEDDPDLQGACELGLHTLCYKGISPAATATAETYGDIAMLLGLKRIEASR